MSSRLQNDRVETETGTRRGIAPGRGDRVLLVGGWVLLAATAATLVVAGARHFSGVHGPVLPVSLCRSGSMTVLPPLSGARWFTSWQVDWIAVVTVAGLALVYLSGVRRMRRLGGWPRRRTWCFLAGLGVVLLATCSSIAVYDMAMFSVHMLGHLMLVMVAPPLLVLGRPLTLTRESRLGATRARIERRLAGRVATFWFSPPVALACYTVVIVGTHLTGLMNVIMSRPWAGQLEHAVYLAVGFQFFCAVLGDEPLRWRLSMPARQALLAVAMAVDTFTGVILLQSTQAISMSGMAPQHVLPLAQTHLGGAIMWVGGDAIMALVMIGIAVNWLRDPAVRTRDRGGWLEQVRTQTLLARTGTGGDEPAPTIGDIDEDDAARAAYNRWLQQL